MLFKALLHGTAYFLIGYVTLAAVGFFGPNEELPTRSWSGIEFFVSLAAGWAIAWAAVWLARGVRRVRRVSVSQQHVGDGWHTPGNPGQPL